MHVYRQMHVYTRTHTFSRDSSHYVSTLFSLSLSSGRRARARSLRQQTHTHLLTRCSRPPLTACPAYTCTCSCTCWRLSFLLGRLAEEAAGRLHAFADIRFVALVVTVSGLMTALARLSSTGMVWLAGSLLTGLLTSSLLTGSLNRGMSFGSFNLFIFLNAAECTCVIGLSAQLSNCLAMAPI